MTIDLSQISYQLVAVMKDGGKINLEGVAENIAWEENENELATRLNLTLRDVKMADGGRLAAKLALCTVVYLFATWGGQQREIFRGTIWEWEHAQMHEEKIVVTCYDLLYYAQKSKDNRYYAKNTKTKTVIQSIFKAWKIEMGEYSGPNVKHKKLLYKNQTVAAMLTETLEDAEDISDGEKGFIRAREGKADVLKRGTNADIFAFHSGQNVITSSDKYSMTDLVTKVVVTGKDDKKGRPKTVSTLKGKTEYGILQEFHSKGDASLKEAKKAAQKILDDRGKPKRTTSVSAPELPAVRKGDRVYIKTDSMDGYFYVKGISHSATDAQMKMEVEPLE